MNDTWLKIKFWTKVTITSVDEQLRAVARPRERLAWTFAQLDPLRLLTSRRRVHRPDPFVVPVCDPAANIREDPELDWRLGRRTVVGLSRAGLRQTRRLGWALTALACG